MAFLDGAISGRTIPRVSAPIRSMPSWRDRRRSHGIWNFVTSCAPIQRAREYEALKIRLATLHPEDISSYSDGKGEFVREMDALAAIWKAGGRESA